MEIIKKPKGRPRVFTDEQRKQNKTRYQLNKEWICPICNPKKNYTLAGKHCHMKTKKHLKMKQVYNVIISIDAERNVHKEIM